MDETYVTKMATSFLDELGEIEKQAGIIGSGLKFLQKGFGRLGQFGKGGAMAASKGTPGHWQRMKNIYQAGGLRGLGRSAYGQAGAAAGLTGLGLYGGYRALGGGQPSYPRGY